MGEERDGKGKRGGGGEDIKGMEEKERKTCTIGNQTTAFPLERKEGKKVKEEEKKRN